MPACWGRGCVDFHASHSSERQCPVVGLGNALRRHVGGGLWVLTYFLAAHRRQAHLTSALVDVRIGMEQQEQEAAPKPRRHRPRARIAVSPYSCALCHSGNPAAVDGELNIWWYIHTGTPSKE